MHRSQRKVPRSFVHGLYFSLYCAEDTISTVSASLRGCLTRLAFLNECWHMTLLLRLIFLVRVDKNGSIKTSVEKTQDC